MGLYSQASFSRNVGMKAMNSTGNSKLRWMKPLHPGMAESHDLLPKIGEILLFKPSDQEDITKVNEKVRTDNNAFGDSSQVPLKHSLKYQMQNAQRNATNNPQQAVFVE